MTNAHVVWGVGSGPTSLAAFDSALMRAGLHNYNLVELSSMLPSDTSVTVEGSLDESFPTGALLPTVIAEKRTSETGDEIAAGIAWQQADEGGVLVEHTASSPEECEAKLSTSIGAVRRNRPSWNNWSDSVMKVASVDADEPSCALVAVALPDAPALTR